MEAVNRGTKKSRLSEGKKMEINKRAHFCTQCGVDDVEKFNYVFFIQLFLPRCHFSSHRRLGVVSIHRGETKVALHTVATPLRSGPINCYHYCHLYDARSTGILSWRFTPHFAEVFTFLATIFFCFHSKKLDMVRARAENSINKDEQCHKIKWHYLKLFFIRIEQRCLLQKNMGRLTIHCVCCMRRLQTTTTIPRDNQFPSCCFTRQKTEIEEDFPMCVMLLCRGRKAKQTIPRDAV